MDRFSTEYLMGVVEDLKRPPSWALDRYFTRIETFGTEAVDFDVIDRKRRVAPLVSPLVPAKVMNQAGRVVRSLTPAYTKDKRVFEPGRGFKRAVGEKIGGSLTPAQRIDLAIVGETEDQMNVLTRRQEVMAVEALRTGKVVLTGDQYPSVTVDFQRDAALTPANLAGAALWSASTSTPLDNLKTWALLGLKKSGVYLTDVVMAIDVYTAFVNHASVSARWAALNSAALGTTLALGKPQIEGGVYMGSIDGFNIFVYAGWYYDETDTEQEILPAKYIIMSAPAAVEGVRAFGAIKDHDSLQEAEFFSKSWTDHDPSVRYIMLQSAPLMTPLRPNASLGVRVN
jgi:hypothetical protein